MKATRHCRSCPNVVGETESWCSPRCHRAEDQPDREDDE